MRNRLWQQYVGSIGVRNPVVSYKDREGSIRLTLKSGTDIQTIQAVVEVLQRNGHRIASRRFINHGFDTKFVIDVKKTEGITKEGLQSLFQEQSLSLSTVSEESIGR